LNFYQQKNQQGFVLVTGLIFILIITVVTVSSMQSSNLDYKISSNEVFKDVAFQGSESGRIASGEALSHFVYNRRWDGLPVTGVSYASAYDPIGDDVGLAEDLYDTNSLDLDLNYDVSGTAVETIEADISLLKADPRLADGSGSRQASGYEGLGLGAGGSGTHLIYEIRSKGVGASEAIAVTASEYRVIP